MSQWENNPAVKNLQEYLRIPSVQPDVDYDGCVEYLKKKADELELPVDVIEIVPKKPIVIISWIGSKPELPSILLNSHMDVVPVYEDQWTHPPFKAHIDDKGFIYARGTQDMKTIGIQHMEAVRRLKNAGVVLKRTVHLSFVPDEEIGGKYGMKIFVKSPEFKALNIGLALDESMPNPEDFIIAFHGERTTCQIRVDCTSEPGHGSMLAPNTAGEKLHYMINKLMGYRANEMRTLITTKCWMGDVTTVNLNKIYGGVQVNVLPDKLSAEFDIRLAPHVDHDEFDKTLQQWCIEAGDGVTITAFNRDPAVNNTKLDDTNSFCSAILKATGDMGVKVDFRVCPGATDSRYIRGENIPAFGFSPLTTTPILLHAHDERVHVDIFLRGIDIFENVIKAVANVETDLDF